MSELGLELKTDFGYFKQPIWLGCIKRSNCPICKSCRAGFDWKFPIEWKNAQNAHFVQNPFGPTFLVKVGSDNLPGIWNKKLSQEGFLVQTMALGQWIRTPWVISIFEGWRNHPPLKRGRIIDDFEIGAKPILKIGGNEGLGTLNQDA